MTTTNQQNEFIEQHAAEGALTPEMAAQVLEMGLQGDTGLAPEPKAAPEPSPKAENTPNADNANTPNEPTPTGDVADPANAVIQAKDGIHTIPYAKLVEAREGAQHWKAQAEAAQAQLAALTAQGAQRAAAGEAPTQIDNQVAAANAAIEAGIDPAIFGDFSETELAKGIETLVAQRVGAITHALESKLAAALAPVQEKQATDARQNHYDAIYAKHPDADSIAESKELADWIERQPSFARDGYRAVLEQGSTQQVIELFDTFKAGTQGTQAPAPTVPDVKAAAKAAVAAAPAAVPASLSDIPGGHAGGNAEEAMASLSGPDLLEAMQEKGWSAAQIESYLNRRL